MHEPTTAVQLVEPDDLEAFIPGWLDEHARIPRTHDAYRGVIEQFHAALRAHGLGLGSLPGLVAAVAQHWASQRADGHRREGEEVKPATRNLRLAALSSFYRYVNRMVDDREVPNPIAKVKRAKVVAYEGAHALEAADVRRRLAEIDRSTLLGLRDYALLSLALETGRRASELRLLTWGNIRQEGDKVRVIWPPNKGRVMRDLLGPRAAAALFAWLRAYYGSAALRTLDSLHALYTLPPTAPICVSLARDPHRRGRSMSRQALSAVWEARLGTSKIHTTRHTFAVQMEKAGARLSEIQARLGHASVQTTGRYITALTSDENPYVTQLEETLGLQDVR